MLGGSKLTIVALAQWIRVSPLRREILQSTEATGQHFIFS